MSEFARDYIMNVSLTPELEKYIAEKIRSGLYNSASEVVRESLRLMHSYEDLQLQRKIQLNQAIEMGFDQLEAGKKVSSATAYQQIKKKINSVAKNRKK